MLITHDLTYRYPGAATTFRFPDLSVDRAGTLLLLGPSGAGKSTWLHLLAGVLSPLAGRMELDGVDYAALSGAKLDRFRGRNIGLVFQRPYFVDALTVEENLAIARRMASLPPDPELLRTTLHQLGIDDHADRLPGQLSVGEQQRATIARALVNRPKLILADEPTSALDRRNASRVSALLRERAAELGAALIVVTHDERLRDDFRQVVELTSLATPN
ncbi:putative ABC transport system ATP-binding protein [Lewinella marina]|uniref:ABC transporter ATP-binding protein n=1 Tax=Neolewinella marina TaxID=438751 RepID=A0A2G0CC23_9BACT|nr:ATP-binding cassette domain-containing protein [Neolewinella marina]NJB86709.1 putative ABC transport system ATP-binding protein [Neolewinella marina]PHK97516.1 ABC transporter ATP-binding protein [Neolewinella marina]